MKQKISTCKKSCVSPAAHRSQAGNAADNTGKPSSGGIKGCLSHRKRQPLAMQKDTFHVPKGILSENETSYFIAHKDSIKTYVSGLVRLIFAHIFLRYLRAHDFIFKIMPYRTFKENQNVSMPHIMSDKVRNSVCNCRAWNFICIFA